MDSPPLAPSYRVNRIRAACALVFLVGCSSESILDTDAGRDAQPDGAATDALIVGGCRLGKPLASEPCFTCSPLPADSHNVGCASPLPTLWGWDGSGIAPGVSYPLECMVYLPVENPYYPGGPQPCSCSAFTDGAPPQWTCGI